MYGEAKAAIGCIWQERALPYHGHEGGILRKRNTAPGQAIAKPTRGKQEETRGGRTAPLLTVNLREEPSVSQIRENSLSGKERWQERWQETWHAAPPYREFEGGLFREHYGLPLSRAQGSGAAAPLLRPPLPPLPGRALRGRAPGLGVEGEGGDVQSLLEERAALAALP